MPHHHVGALLERAAREITEHVRGLEAVVMKERFELSRKELPVCERRHEGRLASVRCALRRLRLLEAHRHEEDLANAIVVEVLLVTNAARRRVLEGRGS